MRSNLFQATALAAIFVIGSFSAANLQAQDCQKSSCPSHGVTATETVSAVQDKDQEVEVMDIVDTAAGAGSFNTLVAAVKAADLVDALKGDGPFTVFAPTDEAFAALPEGTVENLLLPENKEKLVAILKYHVVPGKIMAGDVLGATTVDTLQGSAAPVGLTIGGANVVKADIDCTNGVIHVIDEVILPKM